MIDPTKYKRDWDYKCQDILFCLDQPSIVQALGTTQADAKQAVDQKSVGGRCYLGSSDFSLSEFVCSESDKQRIPFSAGHTSYVTGLTSAGSYLLSAGYDRRLIWWDSETRQVIRQVVAHDRWIRRLISTPDGRRVVTIGDDMLCKIWDVETAELVAAFTDHRPQTPHDYPSMLYALAVSADGRYLATGDKVGHIAVWDAARFSKLAELEAPVMYTWDAVQRHHSIGGIRSLAFSPDGEQLAVGGIGKIGNIDHLGGPARLEIFAWKTGKSLLVKEDEERKGLIEQLLWAPDASWLLAAGGDNKGFVSFWDPTNGNSLHHDVVNGHIHGIAFDAATGTLTAVGHEHITRWSLRAT